MHLYVKGCGTVPCGLILAAGAAGVPGRYDLRHSHPRDVSLEESLCIFWTALLPRMPSIYPLIHASVNMKGPAWDVSLGCSWERITARSEPLCDLGENPSKGSVGHNPPGNPWGV